MKALWASLWIVILALVACSNDPSGAPVLDEAFKLAPSHEATIESEALTLRFVSVDEDSRCPSGGVCVWAGQARITLSASAQQTQSLDLSLTLPGNESVDYADYTIQLLQLDPYPHSGRTIHTDDYRATLLVTRRN